jgi:dihydrofolate synthase / folylpolyglutamate synthase
LRVEVAKQQFSLGSQVSLPSDELEPDSHYRAVLEWIWSFSARPRSPRDMALQRSVKLERMYALLQSLGHPELRFRSLLVAGTKGKGSTVAMLAACLERAGHRTGRYTSPHLLNWRERTTIDGRPISTAEVMALAGPVRAAIDALPLSAGSPTTFEVGTAITFLHFARQNIEVGVIEVGTGGRFDATNLVDAQVGVIAPVSYDHTATLGATLTSIAWHKAGIMRWGRAAVSAPQTGEARAVIEGEARLVHTSLAQVGQEWRWAPVDGGIRIESTFPEFQPLEVSPNLMGAHQADNATTAVAALHAVRERFAVQPSHMVDGLASVDWPGRLQVLAHQPTVVLDGAHNAASAEVVQRALKNDFHYERLHLVLGLSEGKDALGVVAALAPGAARVYLTRSAHERSAPPAQLEPFVRRSAPAVEMRVYENAASAFDAALAGASERDLVLVTGSLFLVGEALTWWRRLHP